MQKESKSDKWLRTGFVLCLAIVLLLIILSGTAKTSDVSNWIIAFANVAMAAAAVKAWLAARKFLSEFFAQEGYRLAIALINENVIHLGIDNDYIICTQRILGFCGNINGKLYNAQANTDLQSLLQEQQTMHENHQNWLKNIRSLSFRMETYGIYPADNKKEALIEMLLALDTLVILGDRVLAELRKIAVSYDEEIRHNQLSQNIIFKTSRLPVMHKDMRGIALEWNKMVINRATLLSGNKHARSLFVVRDKTKRTGTIQPTDKRSHLCRSARNTARGI